MKRISVWDVIKRIYKDKFNVSGKVVDYIAVQKILKCCVDGHKNSVIASITKQPVGYVNDVIVEFLHFYGWKETLDICPLMCYKRASKDYKRFIDICYKESNVLTKDMIKTAFDICVIYHRILGEINKYYANS
jgi:hypothetical protein